jgi:hypothetical protein
MEPHRRAERYANFADGDDAGAVNEVSRSPTTPTPSRGSDESWIGLGSSGAWLTKQAWVDRIQTGATHYDSVRLSNLRVRFPRPGIAVVTGDFMQKGLTGTRDISTVGRYINTWARTGNRWQVISSGFQSTPHPWARIARRIRQAAHRGYRMNSDRVPTLGPNGASKRITGF